MQFTRLNLVNKKQNLYFTFPFILISVFSVNVIPALAKPYFVSVNGNDYKNNGLDSAHPFQTIQKAANLTNPGDTVYIMDGSYNSTCAGCEVVDITRSGTLNNWIVFKNYKNQSPIILFKMWAGILISQGASFIEINGLIVRGNNANINLTDALNQPGGCNNPTGVFSGIYNGSGVGIDGRNGHCHHVRLKNLTIFECPGEGIGVNQCDYITVDSCTVYNNCWYTAEGESGINFFKNWNLDNAVGYHNIITHNKCFGNRLYVPWVGAPCKITDGNGIIIDSDNLVNPGSVHIGRTLIAFNIASGNGGCGIVVFLSSHVDIVNNTAYLNAQSAEIDKGEISADEASDVTMYNNILNASPSKKINTYTYNNDTNVSYDYNLHFVGSGAEITGVHTITADPLFVNPSMDLSVANFRLKQNSPAIAKGLDVATILPGYAWPKFSGAAPDIGAVAYQNASIKSKALTTVFAPSLPIRGIIGRNQVLIKTKQGVFTMKGERLNDRSAL
jgi:hypothetical protein